MIAITNAKIVLENGILRDGVMLIEKDRILSVGKAADVEIPEHATICDAEGLYVGPGFVDIHVHGGAGHFFYENPEKVADHFLRHGETTMLATLYYDLSKEEFLDSIERVKSAMVEGDAAKAIAGFYMEGPYMNPKYGASPEKNKWRGEIKREDYQPIVEASGSLAKVWAIAPEREGVENFVQDAKAVYKDTMFSVGHSEATPEEIRKFKKYGLNLQTHCMNATGRKNRGAGVRSCGPDEACFMDRDMYAEVICDSQGIHVEPDMLRMILQIKGVDKVILISDSYVSNEPVPEQFKDVTDLQFDANGSLSGSKLTLDMACRNLLTHTDCGITQAFLMASRNPARVIGMDHEVGTIEVGKKANLVFVDDMFEVKKVMLEGNFR